MNDTEGYILEIQIVSFMVLTDSDVAKGHAGHAEQDQKITNISFS